MVRAIGPEREGGDWGERGKRAGGGGGELEEVGEEEVVVVVVTAVEVDVVVGLGPN